ncbi:MAG TPA: CHASE2 domain-containing protein [Candidatus Competibacteraceae bacterium]|nr:CHASE2 domain-containing protein [Candidatus Competibacteraceae bacterium]
MRYSNFDLWIDAKVGDQYPVRAASPLGEVRGDLLLDPHQQQIQKSQDQLAKREVDQAGLIDLGRQLYKLVFTGDIELLFEKSVGQSLSKADQGIRIRLRIEAPELIVLPWEFLYWPSKDRFLGTSVQCPVVRYLEIFEPIADLEVALPLKMLVAIPNNPELDAAKEKANLLQTLAGLDDCVKPTFLEGTVTSTRISDALLEERFHLFHFIGHGEFENDQAFLQLNSEDGDLSYIDDSQFASLFLNHSTLKLVFLNSCKGAETSYTAPMAGMAYRLIKQGVPAVVAMQYAIYDETAILFSREFYRSLFKSHARGRVEYAVSHARNRLLGEFPGERDIGAPVLFMRASEGLLFNIVTGKLLSDLNISSNDFHRSEAAKQTYRKNIEDLERKYQESPDQQIQEALDRNTTELARLEQKLRLRRIAFSVATGTSLFVFILSWIQLFDFLPPAIKIESYAIWLAGMFSTRQPSDQIVIVTINARTEQELGKPFGRDWRREHAILIDRLSQAGATVVAFDMYFEEPTTYDDEFTNAIERASHRHTKVVVGFRNLVEGQPKLIQSFKDAGVKLGLLCIGKKWGTSQAAPVVVIKEGQQPALYSLALEITAAFQEREIVVDQNIQEIDFLNPATRQIITKLAVSEVNQVKWEQPACPAIGKHDTSASIIIDSSFLNDPKDPQSKYPYESIIKNQGNDLSNRFKNKIVLVGVERKVDLFPIQHGLTTEERYGVELHSAVIHSLLDGKVIQPLGSWQQFLIMMVLGLLGGLIRLKILVLSPTFRAGILTIVFLLYFGIASYIFQAYLIILNTVYHILAFGVSYWTVGTVKRRWFQ